MTVRFQQGNSLRVGFSRTECPTYKGMTVPRSELDLAAELFEILTYIILSNVIFCLLMPITIRTALKLDVWTMSALLFIAKHSVDS